MNMQEDSMSDCTCFKKPGIVCPVHIPAGQVEPAVSAWDLLGIAPDFTGGLTVDEYMDEQRSRG